MPRNAEQYYGFTYFAISLNEITKDIKGSLPPTDTRLRPDQRAFEEGKVDEAEKTKQDLEGRQRERRKEMEGKGESFEPRWFHKAKGEEPEWQFGGKAGKYFEMREKKEWKEVPKIFE